MAKSPAFTFLFPYRWIAEDKEYFAENIRRQVERFITNSDKNILLEILRYRVVLVHRSNNPKKVNISKTLIEKALKPIFPNAKCIAVDIEFEGLKSNTLLPVFDFQLYL